jgi:hypothetical protein
VIGVADGRLGWEVVQRGLGLDYRGVMGSLERREIFDWAFEDHNLRLGWRLNNG